MFKTMMQATKFNRGGNSVDDWRTTAAVVFRPVFLDWRLCYENQAGESNIPQIYLWVSYSVAFVAGTR